MAAPQLQDLGDGNWQLSGELLFSNVTSLVRQPDFRSVKADDIRIDLAGVTRAESAGLALLLEWCRAAEQLGKTISFVNMPQQMQSIAAVCGLGEILITA